MRVALYSLTFAVLALFSPEKSGSTTQLITDSCPTIITVCPRSAVAIGSTLEISAELNDLNSHVTPTWNWSVSAGKIIEGQGTSRIKVDTTGLETGEMTITAEISGLPSECRKVTSCTATLVPEIRDPVKFDTIGPVSSKDEHARLDNVAAQLKEMTGTQAFFIAYGGRRGPASEAQNRGDRAKRYLVNKREIDPSRITLIDGGYREQSELEIWILPVGSVPPTPTPDPNVEHEDAPETN